MNSIQDKFNTILSEIQNDMYETWEPELNDDLWYYDFTKKEYILTNDIDKDEIFFKSKSDLEIAIKLLRSYL